MSDVTRLLNAMEQGDSQAATALLPLVYDELRRLAGHKMANEAAGHTLQPTALVHEAWLRLVGDDASAEFVNRAHFFAAAAELLARLIAHDLRTNPRLVLGLATGRTMESVYDRLARMHLEDGLSFAGARSFNLDEYVGLPASDPHSYRHYMDEHLFNKVNVDLCNTHLPDGTAGDLDKECAAYEALMVKCGGIDLQLLGIGQTGHIGFNEPLSALRSRTRVKALSPVTVAQNASLFADPSKMPRRAITMGVGTILEARRVVLLATGAGKAEIIAKAVEGPITSMISATALQMHARCTVIVDEAAAAKLQGVDYYRWIFANEPEWEPYRG